MTPNGCEAIIHAARHRTDPRKVAISVDASNAFNSIHRSAVLRAIRVHFQSLGSTAVTAGRGTLFTGSGNVASQVNSSARGVQQGDPSVWSFSLLLSTLPSWRPAQLRIPHTREASISALSSSMKVFVLVPPSSSLSLMASAASGSPSIWTRPRSSPRAPPPSRSHQATSRGAPGTGPPTSSSWEHLSAPTSGVKSFWAVVSPRPGHSCQPLASSRMPKALSACCVRCSGWSKGPVLLSYRAPGRPAEWPPYR